MREEALARANVARKVANSCKPKGCPWRVGHHVAGTRPKSFYVQLNNDDLFMLVIPKEFRAYVKGHPYPKLVVIKSNKECEWVVHANPYKDEVVLDKGWPDFAKFHNLKVGDYVMLKVIAYGFKMTIFDRITYYQKELTCSDHSDLN